MSNMGVEPMCGALCREVDKPFVLRHPLLWLLFSVMVGAGATFALLSPFHSRAGIAAGIIEAFREASGDVRKAGPVAITILGLALMVGAAWSALAWLHASVRLRVLACIAGVPIAWSLMAAGSGVPEHGQEFATGRPLHWASYLVYNGVRWASLSVLASCLVVCLFRCVIWHIARAEHEGELALTRDDAVRAKDVASNQPCTDQLTRYWHAVTQAWWRVFSFAQSWFITMQFGIVMLVALIIVVCWLPWIIWMGPANIGPDTVAQLVWYRTGHAWDPSSRQDLPAQFALSDHHPWLTTLIYGWFDQWGVSLGNEALGLWILAVVHVALIAVAFAILITYLCGSVGLSWKFGVFATLFAAFVPIYGRQAMSIVKDLTFLPFFMVWIVLFIEYIRRVLAQRKIGVWLCIGLVALAVLCGLMKKTGVYVLLASLLVLLVVLRARIITGLMMVVIVAVSMAIPKVAYPTLHIYPGGPQERIAVPLQQSAGILLRHGDTIDAQDKAVLETIFGACTVDQLKERFTTETADGAKDCYNRDATSEQYRDFMLTWAKLAAQHPATAFEATPSLFQAFLMSPYYDEGFSVRWGWEDQGGTMILPQYRDHEASPGQLRARQLYMIDAGLPVVGVLMTEGLYSLWLPVLALVLCLALRRYRNLLYLAPFLIMMGTMLLSPMHQFRYTWPMAFCAVLVMAIAFIKAQTAATLALDTMDDTSASAQNGTLGAEGAHTSTMIGSMEHNARNNNQDER
ncbi:DUF6020 family protein [Bifidobacterium gallicum]|uniref:Uncharacterized protein n=1 Tax=Bifidobacterium gallicum DSM 20093 = LMG 11596 TaxID=561180 RepID=D1NVS5_9BIFI|nr:DUF6020 family protein [Bifidobacterium gallicum]EFA22926.1 hypothetical protein BIFGAL_03968 [Bifidobacterium gallicum DSM 20093 = LMG 11596]KFI59378.1 hypothetical protein BGLCM_0488 [Bifidobacterium gallicum DSM 20093 = LMG 11596]